MWSQVICCQYLRYLMVGCGGLISHQIRLRFIIPSPIHIYFFSFLVDFFFEAGVWAALGGSG